MRFSFSSGSFPTYSLPALFELGSESGADAIEIMLTPRLLAQGSTRLRFLEEGYRLPIASVHSVLRLRGNTPEQVTTDLIDSARLASRLDNCRSLVVHLPPGESRLSALNGGWIDAVLRAREIMERRRGAVSLENPDPGPDDPPEDSYRSLVRWKALVQEFGLNATFDTAHAAMSGWDLLELAWEAGAHVDNIHLSDVGGRQFRNGLLNSLLHQHRPPGSGDLELERFLARLSQTDFSGLITLEISPLRLPWYWLPAARVALSEMLAFCRRSAGDPRQSPIGKRRRRTSKLDR